MADSKMDDLARSKTEILYKEVLGDIHAVIERVEELKRSIAATAGEFNEAIAPNIGVMVDTAKTLRLDAAALLGAQKKAASEAADAAGNKAIDKIASITVSEANRLKTVSDTLASEIGAQAALEVQRLVAVPVTKAVDNVLAAATGMDIAKGELDAAAATVRMAMWKRVAWTFGAALVGAALALIGAQWWGPKASGVTDSQMAEITKHHRAIFELVEKSCKK